MGKRDKLRRKIFASPTASDLGYTEVVSWLQSQGAVVDESKAGSAIMIEWGGKTLRFHRPHGKGGTVLPKYVVELVREYIVLVESSGNP